MLCEKRSTLYYLTISQLLAIICRQIFDYLGYMWATIILNFFQIIFIIFGFFGTWQLKSKYVICYIAWNIFWCCWNIFLICFYLNVGVLNRESDLLSMGTGSVSWWEINGPGCKAFFQANETSLENNPWRPPRPNSVGCIWPFYYIETIQSAIQLFFSIFGSYIGMLVNRDISKERNPAVENNNKPSPFFTVDYIKQNKTENSSDYFVRGAPSGTSSRPMTPRRVKRRNGYSRSESTLPRRDCSTLNRTTGTFRNSSRSSRNRRSVRHSLQSTNTMLKYLTEQPGTVQGGHVNSGYEQSSSSNSFKPNEIDRPTSARSSYSNFHGARGFSYRQNHNFLASGPPGYSSNQSETGV